MKKFIVVFGTRPEIIKLAPVIREIQKAGHQAQVVHTGQHQDMASSLIDFFGIKVDVNLSLMTRTKGLSDLYAKVIQGLDESGDKKADGIFVQGDTTSCAAAAVWGFLNKVPVFHIEAGLRTFDLASPWPEEFNRRLAGLSAHMHFCPSNLSRQNLLNEKVDEKNISVVGNTVIDSLMWVSGQIDENSSLQADLSKKFSYLEPSKKLVLATVHRRESFGAPSLSIFQSLNSLADQPDVQVILPLHKNPNVQKAANEVLAKSKVRMVEPLDYVDFVYLMKRSALILSDSGGVQEEAPALGKRVLVLRESSERPEALETGLCELIGTDGAKIFARAQVILNEATKAIPQFPFGDGRSAARIVCDILKLGMRSL